MLIFCSTITAVLGREDLLVAVEVICDYLSEELANTLLKSYGLTIADFNSKNTPAKRKADWEVALEVLNSSFSVAGLLFIF